MASITLDKNYMTRIVLKTGCSSTQAIPQDIREINIKIVVILRSKAKVKMLSMLLICSKGQVILMAYFLVTQFTSESNLQTPKPGWRTLKWASINSAKI